ncbi:hypothetical protein JST56_05590 [Candidatus Dependentiae bacterium]|nr:hypothetical protein [Candidatus Dependentiae bacterium]
MFNKNLMLFLMIIITGSTQFKSNAMRLERSFDLTPDYNFSFFQNSLFEISKEKIFFNALLQNNEVALLADYLLDLPENLQLKVLPEAQYFKRGINLYLYVNNISLPQSIYECFCNPLQNDNLIQLIYYAHTAGLSVVDVEKIRLLSLAIYAPCTFYAIAQTQAAIKAMNFSLVNYLFMIGIQKSWIVAYAGKSEFNQPLYHYV